MRIGELSSCSGVPVSTIKYYLREGLLPAGELTSANQARYDEGHLRRLRLVRALIDVGGLPVSTVCEVLNAVDEAEEPRRELLRLVQHGITTEPAAGHDEVAERETREFLARQGWNYDEDNPAVRSLVTVLATARALGHEHFIDSLDTYADACRHIAEADVTHALDHREATDVVEGLVVDTVLGDAALRALRRLGQWEKLNSGLQQPDTQPHRRDG
ncbi:MerR family transcriptional regulator [Lentzea sp. E54]|uniref:MerR family transcriptional regulator n=1 Tax=Lentzea xerophila TaxID=3435883 RepID=UPI003DA33676